MKYNVFIYDNNFSITLHKTIFFKYNIMTTMYILYVYVTFS